MSASPFSKKELYDCGKVRRFRGSEHPELAFPVGGIGTGTISLGARGELRDWEIFLRPNKGLNLPYTFFAARARLKGERSVTKVLEARHSPPYTGGHGYLKNNAAGLPHFQDTEFIGEYPFARVNFIDREFPLKVSMEVFNPFIPLEPDDSGIPAAIFLITMKNIKKRGAEASLAFSMLNPCGYDSRSQVSDASCTTFGKNINEFVKKDGLSCLFFTTKKHKEKDYRFGSMAVSTVWKDVSSTPSWRAAYRPGTLLSWWNELSGFWDDFSEDGALIRKSPSKPSSSADGGSDTGSIALSATLKPGEAVTFPIIISWYFPNFINYWDDRIPEKKREFKKYYSNLFNDAADVAGYIFENYHRLEGKTREFHRLLFSSTLPGYVIDAVTSQMSIIRTQTCFRTADGNFYGFEGCSDNAGCCPMNCTHVWNYEQSLAHLFPTLERSMRETDFLSNVEKDGKMAFRTTLPPGLFKWDFHPAADGQMGAIMRLYREWKYSGDNEFLGRCWPNAKKALEFAWKKWDRNKDGVMEGQQHNTYDIEFYGANTMTGLFYLGALKACAEMAKAMGDEKSTATYEDVFKKGKTKYDRLLWNGKYYVQKYNSRKYKHHQYGKGCLSDQVLGQWLAEIIGLGELLPRRRVRKALASIFKYNFRTDFNDHINVQRIYAIGDEKGLLLCTWPLGGREKLPFPYCDEVWTGFEYEVASHMIHCDMLDEGLTIVKAARERYDGHRRNPWNEVECGHHYVRAMSSWALLTGLSGFQYDGVKNVIRFSPRISQSNFKCFFSTGTCWGQFRQIIKGEKANITIKIHHGRLKLNCLILNLPGPGESRQEVEIRLAEDLLIESPDELRITV